METPVRTRNAIGGYPTFDIALHPLDNHYDLRFHQHTLLEMEDIANAFSLLGCSGTAFLVRATIQFETYRIPFEKNRDGEFKTTEGALKREKRPLGLFPHEWALLEMHGAYGMRNPPVLVFCPCGCQRPIHRGSKDSVNSGHPTYLVFERSPVFFADFKKLRLEHLATVKKFIDDINS